MSDRDVIAALGVITFLLFTVVYFTVQVLLAIF